jgi:hypothetical protein
VIEGESLEMGSLDPNINMNDSTNIQAKKRESERKSKRKKERKAYHHGIPNFKHYLVNLLFHVHMFEG